MIHNLKLSNGPNSVELTYDGLGLRVEGSFDVEQKSSRRTLSDLTIVPIAKVNVLSLVFDNSTHLLRIHALIPRQHALPDSPLDLCIFRCSVEQSKAAETQAFCSAVMAHIYEGITAGRRLKVLVNPFSGQGHAKKIFKEKVSPVFESAQCNIDYQETEYQGHAIEIAKELDVDAYDAIVTVSGDGIIHEIINGFSQRPDARTALKKVPLGVIPGGTGNALSICMLGEKLGFDPIHTARQVVKGKNMAFDLCSVTYDDHRYMSFLSHNYGITSYADLATESMRWMGDTRTIVGLLQQIFTGASYQMEAAVQIVETSKDKIKSSFPSEVQVPATGSGPIQDTIPDLSQPVPDDWTVIKGDVSFFLTSKTPWLARGMLSHPCAEPNDGLLDLFLVRSNHSLFSKLDLFGKVETGHQIDSDAVEYYKVKAFRLTPIAKPGKKVYVAIDGEHAPAKTFQVEVHPGLGSVLSLYPNYANARTWRPSGVTAARQSSSFKSKLSAMHNKLRSTCAYILSLIRNYFRNIFRRTAAR
ncbi:ATP-NAD kinase-like domain-containing protein [Fennellomyces sp. T-0311]|nr:ATP-NAD kinase-like domain-containing protein [Fennellomyces sp. T-0311]